jgi:uncharacterized small protein (DUF1192 family)
MSWDDLEPRKAKPLPKNLDNLGVVELREYIGELEAEIARAQSFIDKKQAHKAGAEEFFKK